jgi:antitoxin (DNA-binding transcriptional repressor) of toxin-antitoxin stability system
MRRTNSVELRNHLSDTLNFARYGRERIEVRRRGRLLAAIVPPEDLVFLQENHALTKPQRAARAADDLRILGFLPPPGLFAIEIGMNWQPRAGWPEAGWPETEGPEARSPEAGLHEAPQSSDAPPESPAPCDPLL